MNLDLNLSLPSLDLRYRRQESLGQGASGRVYRAWDDVGSKAVAIKCFDGHIGGSDLTLRQRFWRWARLAHPNLAHILDFGVDAEGTPLLVMELIEGQDLRHVARTRQMNRDQVRSIVRDIARGLAYLHERGIVHGDVKPGNCLLTPEGVKLVDWDSEGMGTLAYMRPERLHGAAPAVADDLYALGVVGTELLLDTPIIQVSGVQELRQLLNAKSEGASPLERLLDDLMTGRIADPAECLARLEADAESLGGESMFRAEAPLIARDEPLQRLDDALRGTRADTGAWIVWGEAGIGKSRLVREWLQTRAALTAVFTGQCTPSAQAFLQPWRDALAPLTLTHPPAQAVIPEWLTGQGSIGKERLFEAIASWLRQIPEYWMVIEDLQWADQTSLELFIFLASRLAEPGQAGRLLATSRPADQVAPLLELQRFQAVRLAPLDPDASTALLEAHVGAKLPPGAFTRWAFDLTGGNPLHLGELAAHLVAEGAICVERGVAQFPDEPPAESPGLQGLVRQVASRLPSDAQDLLFWGTLLGKRFTLAQLHRACGWSEDRLFAAIEKLSEGRFWIQTGETLDFRHDRLRESLQDTWDAERCKAGHLHIARLLEQSHAHPGVLASHFDRADAWEEALLHYQAAAAQRVAEGALGDAAALWERALALLDLIEGELPDSAPPEAVSQTRFDLWERMGSACLSIDMTLSVRILAHLRRRLLAEAPDALRGPLPEDALDGLTDEQLARPYQLHAPGTAPADTWPTVLLKYQMYAAYEGLCQVLIVGPEGAEPGLAEAETLLPSPRHWLKGLLDMPRCTALGWLDQLGNAGKLSEKAVALLDQAPSALRGTLRPLYMQAYIYQLYAALMGHAQCPTALHETYLAEARAGHRRDLVALLRTIQMAGIGMSGGRAEFLAAVTEYENALESCGVSRVMLVEGSCQRLAAWFEQGQWALVADQVDTFPSMLKGSFYETWFLSYVAMALCALKRPEEAADVIHRIETETTCRGYGYLLARAWLAVARGDEDALARLDEALARDGSANHYQVTRCMWGLRVRAELLMREGRDALAHQALDEAAAIAERDANRLQSAITELWAGRLARDAEARERHFEAAEAGFAALGNPDYVAMLADDRRERWWMLHEGGSPPVPDVRGVEATLRTVVESAMDTARADRGKLLLLDPGGEMRTRVSLSRPGMHEVESYSHTVARYVLESGKSLWLADVTRDARFQRGVSLVAMDLRTVICVPLRWGNRLRGLLYLDRQEASEAFTQEDFRLVEALAGYGALALAHAEVAEQEQRQRRQAEALLEVAKALRSSDPERLRADVAAVASAALACRHVEVSHGPEPLHIEWSSPPTEEQQALASGIGELAALAIERADLHAREQAARLQQTLAEELTREREALIRQILHDLRNSVQGIALMNMDLAHWAKAEPDAASSVAAIDHQVTFMARFLQQKLDMVSGARQAHQETDIPKAMCDLEARFRPHCLAKGQTLRFVAQGAGTLLLSEVEFSQVVSNLLENACKFTPDGGSITVSAHTDYGWFTLEVRDTGPGFSGTLHAEAKGYGIGMEHAHQLVLRAGGWLNHEDLAVGAVVRIGLPTLSWGTANSSGVD